MSFKTLFCHSNQSDCMAMNFNKIVYQDEGFSSLLFRVTLDLGEEIDLKGEEDFHSSTLRTTVDFEGFGRRAFFIKEFLFHKYNK